MFYEHKLKKQTFCNRNLIPSNFLSFDISDVYLVLILMIHHETKNFSLPLIAHNQLLHFKTYNVGYAEIV